MSANPPGTTSTKPHRYTSEEAFAAVRAFNDIAPQLTMYARHITGNPHLRVESTDGIPSTDGRTIFIRPPLGFGIHRVHDRPNCGRRDDEYRQLCDACDKRELIDYFLFHEIAHVAFNSARHHGAHARKVFEEFLRTWHPRDACSHAIQIADRRAYTMDVINLTGLLNPILVHIVNAFEDARVNEAMFQDRIGLRPIFAKYAERIAEDSSFIGEEFGGRGSLKVAPLDVQFVLGIMLKAMSIDPGPYMCDEAYVAVNDTIVNNICANVASATDTDEIMQLAYDVFVRANELGYCVVPKCEPAPPPPPMPPTPEQPDENDPSDDNKDPSSQKGEGSGLKAGDGQGDVQENDDKPEDKDETDGADDSTGTPGDDETSSGGSSGKPSPESPDDELDGEASPDGSEAGEGEEGEPDAGDPGSGVAGSDVNAADVEDRDAAEDDGDPDGDDSDAGSDDGAGPSAAGSGTGDSDVEDVEGGPDSSPGSRSEDSEAEGLDSPGSERGGSDEDSTGLDEPGSEVEPDVNSGNGGKSSSLDTESGNQADDESAEYTDADDTDPWDTPAPPPIDHEAVLTDAFNGPSVDADGQTEPTLGHGDPSDIADALKRLLGHDVMDKMAGGDISDITGSPEGQELSREDRDKLSMAIFQALSFDSASREIAGIEMIKWSKSAYMHTWRRASEETVERYMPEAGSMSRAMLIGRRAFEDNRKAKVNRNQTSGRIKAGVLGSRAPIGDERLFGSKTIPKKRSYKVVICVDCSGSMGSGDRMRKIKRMVFMQAELLHGLGIPFEVFAYSGGRSTTGQFTNAHGVARDVVYIQQVKEMNETWSTIPKSKLAGLEPVGANLDGHTMEYARKRLQKYATNTTDPILVYFTDGDMPMENYVEEREILERETELMRRLGITALGVGLHTNSPSKYGLETVQVDSDADIILVVEQLERALTDKRRERR